MEVGLRARVEVLCRWFEKTGVKQYALAHRVGVNPTTMSQIVNRHARPSLEVFSRMVRETGIPSQDLLDDLMGIPGAADREMPANVTSLQVARFKRRNGSTTN
jgi:transcriptional regulator with XRE-family HTH domain